MTERRRRRCRPTPWVAAGVLALCLTLGVYPQVQAVQQFKGVCARVKIEILQELTLERIGFLATLRITNNESEAPITDFAAVLTFADPSRSAPGDPHDASNLFFVQPPELAGIDGVDGSGSIPAATTAEIRWFIIPTIDAGGTTADGVTYKVGATLSGAIFGQPIDPDTLRVVPDTIVVKPEPQLEITYFQPRDVDGDDPFTVDVVESPIPFTLGVLVKNAGYGLARRVTIASQQPRIVENREGLLLIAQLLGARIDDEPTDETSLTVNLGNIEPARCRKGAWDMITSLSGEFVSVDATCTHASELGGAATSIITAMNAFFIAHEVRNDLPGRDDLLDFLADTDDDPEMIPDTLYESDCNVLPVNHLPSATVAGNALAATVTVQSDREDWVYLRVDDPAQAKVPIAEVLRSDGKVLDPHNYWTHVRYTRDGNTKRTYLNLFDFVGIADYQYQVTYAPAGADTAPPVTQLRFSGASHAAGDRTIITPATQLYFTVADASPTGTYYRLDGAADFQPAYPFTLDAAGEHNLTYYSQDTAGNREADRTTRVVVSADHPEVAGLAVAPGRFVVTGDLVASRAAGTQLHFTGSVPAGGLDAAVDIYRGVVAWPTLWDVPSSPTPADHAILTVDGRHVDYYRYRRGADAWSAEAPVADPIELTGLPAGTVDLYVSARNAHGDYLPDAAALHVTWEVDPAAPATRISALQALPCHGPDAAFAVTGPEMVRHRLNGGYFHAEADATEEIVLTRLTEGEHLLEVIGRFGDDWQAEEAATGLAWSVDRGYGTDFSSLTRVRHARLDDVHGDPHTFTWDGRDDDGHPVAAGWYTLRLTLTDDLGRSTRAAEVVRIDHFGDGPAPLAAGPGVHQRYPRARGHWAVWQDQQGGDWDVYALDLNADAPLAQVIGATARSEERPHTDGRYMVWEARQADGSRDIWITDLDDGTEPAAALTATPDVNERHPAVDYPWVVYQTRPVADPAAPWQLTAHHLIDGRVEPVDPAAGDQLYPDIHRQRVVWQDFRDPGWGEIYVKDLVDGTVRRLTTSIHGQYFPVIRDRWVVWADNRHTQLDLYGYDLEQEREVRLTASAENETRPHLQGDWVVYTADTPAGDGTNLRLLGLPGPAQVQLTNTPGAKEMAGLAAGRLVWEASDNGTRRIMTAPLPRLQTVFRNHNTVVVTPALADYHTDAFTLLERWQAAAGVTRISCFTQMVPAPVAESAAWQDGQATGDNFALTAGTFVWVAFAEARILELGDGTREALTLAEGINVVSHCGFPDGFSAYRLIAELGADVVRAVRMLDAATGRWVMATVVNGLPAGEDFAVPATAVLILDIEEEVPEWKPWE